MKKNTKIVIAYFALFYIFFTLLFLAIFFSLLYDVKNIPFDVTIIDEGNKVGFNVANDSLHFGNIPAGAYSKRYIIISTDHDSLLLVKSSLFWKDMIYVNISNPSFIKEGERYKVQVMLLPKENLKSGTYRGNLTLYFFHCPSICSALFS